MMTNFISSVSTNNESYSLYYLLPPKRDTYLVSRLRSASISDTPCENQSIQKLISYLLPD